MEAINYLECPICKKEFGSIKKLWCHKYTKHEPGTSKAQLPLKKRKFRRIPA